jgi:hypothetical protein
LSKNSYYQAVTEYSPELESEREKSSRGVMMSQVISCTHFLQRKLFASFKISSETGCCWWLRPIILATQKAEIRRISVRSQPEKIVCETVSQKKKKQKKTITKKGWRGSRCRP